MGTHVAGVNLAGLRAFHLCHAVVLVAGEGLSPSSYPAARGPFRAILPPVQAGAEPRPRAPVFPPPVSLWPPLRTPLARSTAE